MYSTASMEPDPVGRSAPERKRRAQQRGFADGGGVARLQGEALPERRPRGALRARPDLMTGQRQPRWGRVFGPSRPWPCRSFTGLPSRRLAVSHLGGESGLARPRGAARGRGGRASRSDPSGPPWRWRSTSLLARRGRRRGDGDDCVRAADAVGAGADRVASRGSASPIVVASESTWLVRGGRCWPPLIVSPGCWWR
jgi:hypothetical protein